MSRTCSLVDLASYLSFVRRDPEHLGPENPIWKRVGPEKLINFEKGSTPFWKSHKLAQILHISAQILKISGRPRANFENPVNSEKSRKFCKSCWKGCDLFDFVWATLFSFIGLIISQNKGHFFGCSSWYLNFAICLPLFPKYRPRFPHLARGFQSLARDLRVKCLCLEIMFSFFFSADLSALDVNAMFVHVFILVLMGLLTALQPWVGLACSTYMCMQLLLLIITTLIITTLISSHLIASSLSLISLSSTALSLSLSHQHQHQHQF